MQAVLLAVKTVGSLVGIGGTASAGGLGALSSTLTTVGTIYSTIYGMKVAKAQEAAALENAERATFTGQVSAQDSDIEAAAIIAAEQEGRAFSGFASSSGSYRRADRRNRIMARRDSERIRHDAAMESAQYKAEAAAKRTERKGMLMQGIFSTLGNIADMKTSLISDASLTDSRKTAAIGLTRPSVGYTRPVSKKTYPDLNRKSHAAVIGF